MDRERRLEGRRAPPLVWESVSIGAYRHTRPACAAAGRGCARGCSKRSCASAYVGSLRAIRAVGAATARLCAPAVHVRCTDWTVERPVEPWRTNGARAAGAGRKCVVE